MQLQLNLKEPAYYHREFKRDFGHKTDDSWSQTFKDAGTTLLPLLTFYRPLAFPVIAASSAVRTYRHGSALKDIMSAPKVNNYALGYCSVQTVLSTAALAGTLVSHPLGLVISSGQDLLTDTYSLILNLKNGKKRAAFENSLQIVNNAFYLAVLVKGSFGLVLASLALQSASSLYHAVSAYEKCDYIQSAAHFAMAGARNAQLTLQIEQYLNPPPPAPLPIPVVTVRNKPSKW